jgi:hypothetical protein
MLARIEGCPQTYSYIQLLSCQKRANKANVEKRLNGWEAAPKQELCRTGLECPEGHSNDSIKGSATVEGLSMLDHGAGSTAKDQPVARSS